jgi:hypothetical protein
MSNPAVITLANSTSRKGKFKRFVVEDNIGESVHLHIDNMRIDFTINEFLEFSKMTRTALQELDIFPGYSIDDFDEHFLMEIGSQLPNLESIKIEEVKLSELRCIVSKSYKRGLVINYLLPIQKTPVYRYLTGDTNDYENYKHYNYFGVDNHSRINLILKSIQDHKYPYKNKYIILTNGQDIIRDGQHRAAVLYHLHGEDYKVKIMRFSFKGSSHYMRIKSANVLRIIKWFLLFMYKKLK